MLASVRLTINHSAIRNESLHGKSYLVAPMVMITEGVHNGSGGNLLYKADDIKKAVQAWNMKPVVVYHPTANGQGISAVTPDILETQAVGMILNTCWDGKLRAEAWIDIAQSNKVDERIIEALEENKIMEVSTGLFTENIQEEGEWAGKEYSAIATNHQPDHLALLPDKIGACSIADGAGLLQLNEVAKTKNIDMSRVLAREMDHIRRMVGNAMSHSNVHSGLNSLIQARLNLGEDRYVWVMDVYDDFFVYELDNTLYKLDYTIKGEVVELSGEAVTVVRVTEYKTISGEFVGNDALNKENVKMDKAKLVDNLIANKATQWAEDDRESLMAMNEKSLEKMAPVENAEPEVKADEKPADEKPADEVIDNEAEKPQTVGEYISNAPEGIRDVLTNAVSVHNTQKDSIIESIIANDKNTFSKEFLACKGIEELQGLAALAVIAPVVNSETPLVAPIAMFAGQGEIAPVTNADDKEEVLAMPTMNFENKAK